MARYNQPYILTEANFSLSLLSSKKREKKETNKKVFCVCLYTIYCLLLHEYENQMLDLVYYILNFFLPFPLSDMKMEPKVLSLLLLKSSFTESSHSR